MKVKSNMTSFTDEHLKGSTTEFKRDIEGLLKQKQCKITICLILIKKMKE